MKRLIQLDDTRKVGLENFLLQLFKRPRIKSARKVECQTLINHNK